LRSDAVSPRHVLRLEAGSKHDRQLQGSGQSIHMVNKSLFDFIGLRWDHGCSATFVPRRQTRKDREDSDLLHRDNRF
jgi:hypothetical protein